MSRAKLFKRPKNGEREYETKEEGINTSPILHGKHAVVFGAGASIGAAVAKEFAAEIAEIFLAGRT
jgi:FlaA1/EpsC-like NDP-sugar epimerase